MAQKKTGKSMQSQPGSRKHGSSVAKKNTLIKLNVTGPKSKKRSRRKQPTQPNQPNQSNQSNQPNPILHRAYLKVVFEKYPSFDYDGSKPVMSEFYRMCDEFGWEKGDQEREEARDSLKDALVQEFNAIYGTDHKSLAAWQSLCRVLNLTNVPNEMEACRQLVKSMHVNIVDLVDTPATQEPVTHFVSEAALSTYTVQTGKYFPKENAYAGGLLKYLLRNIINPGKSHRRR
ncbi:unnamed protein product [Rhizoctonia solani]|uniref:Uncharacterized protein n=1 Tax=Rhizoctonia solani TaxID=456999 RepID=A0A8H3CU19_9AGAM|nr:unnamed protein product [Rhizoctonia solani]CAE6494207.1 unnamed protein product [Rhizoctonia solani]